MTSPLAAKLQLGNLTAGLEKTKTVAATGPRLFRFSSKSGPIINCRESLFSLTRLASMKRKTSGVLRPVEGTL